jgi:hypothetical protein
MQSLSYKPNCAEVLSRLRAFCERRAGDRLFATMAVPSRAIEQFCRQYPEPQCDYPDPLQRVEFWDAWLQERSAVEDDSLPSAYLSEFDQGLYGGLLGGEVRFLTSPDTGWISSMVPPLLQDWSQFEQLRFDSAHPWWQRYCRQLEVFVARAAEKWGLSHFILIDSLNFVFELVGATQTYLSVAECPELVCRAIDFAFDLNVRVHEKFFATVPRLQDGTLSNFAQWFPGRVISESIDPFHMTSVAYFEQWGRAPVERIFATFDGGMIHIHGNGRHLLPAAATLRGLKAIALLDDKGFPLAFDVLKDLKAHAGDVPLGVFVEYNRFVEQLGRHELPGGVLYRVRNVPSVDAANRCMEAVRAYRV